ncbi:MAG: translation elongation factor Ts [Kiritimatiellia bacterium]|jgi:elongation factor Ts
MEISAALVKELRDATNVGMMECKRALVEAKGDKAAAIKLLRERGMAIAAKKSGRTVNQGMIAAAIVNDGRTGSLVEVNCETDFVAKNDGFRAFVQELANKATADDEQLAEKYKDEIVAKIAEIGENIVVRRNLRFHVSGTGLVASYIHHGSSIGVLLEVAFGKPDTAAALGEFLKDICMHIAASSPKFIDRAAVTPAIVASEREIFAKQVQGKPANIVEKIVDGKMNKFYEQVCLLEQPFVRDQEQKVQKLLELKNKETDDTIVFRRFARFQVGEALE